MIFTSGQKTTLLGVINSDFPSLVSNRTSLQEALNASASIANPSPQGNVPLPYTLAMIEEACSAPSRPGLLDYLAVAAPLIIMQDSVHLSEGLDGLVVEGAITSGDSTAMKAVLDATQLDPNWKASVPGPTPFQSLFPGLEFAVTVPNGDGTSHVEIHSGTCTPEMITEVLA